MGASASVNSAQPSFTEKVEVIIDAYKSLNPSFDDDDKVEALKVTYAKSFVSDSVKLAAEWLHDADALLITTGAGFGVDSGLPDFRGPEGFWRAYPPMQKLGLEFSEVSNPKSFENDPRFGWGFFGHRYNLYSSTKPHAGFQILTELCGNGENKLLPQDLPFGHFIFTSNVDGHFQKAGFEEAKVLECHGSVHYLQCTVDEGDCQDKIWEVDKKLENIGVNDEFLAVGELPLCPDCGKLGEQLL